MDIAGISLGIYVVVSLVSIVIGVLTNQSKLWGNLFINAGGMTLFFLLQRQVSILGLQASPYVSWFVHPLVTTIAVGYGIGTFGEKFLVTILKAVG